MDLKTLLGEKFDPEAKYELFDLAIEHQIGTPGLRVGTIPDPDNRRTLVVYDVRQKAAEAHAAAPEKKKGRFGV